LGGVAGEDVLSFEDVFSLEFHACSGGECTDGDGSWGQDFVSFEFSFENIEGVTLEISPLPGNRFL
jgi:hypothetical protein